MPRNLNRRVEVLFPVENQKLIRRLRDRILQKYLEDEACARVMHSDGVFERVKSESNRKPLNSQMWFLKHDA
jgi:polyphosphate kinase